MSTIVLSGGDATHGYDMRGSLTNVVMSVLTDPASVVTTTATQITVSNGIVTLVAQGNFSPSGAAYPTSGAVTSMSWTLAYEGQPPVTLTATGFSQITVQNINAWATTENYGALQNAVFGGDDTITGTGANDGLVGSIGNDIINGGGGEDYIRVWFGEGHDTIDGGAGSDFLELELWSAFQPAPSLQPNFTFSLPDMASNAGWMLADGTFVKNVETFRIVGGNNADTFVVGAAVSNDFALLDGAGGIDLLRADLSSTNVGVDLFASSPSQQGVFQGYDLLDIERYNVKGGSAADYLYGGEYADTFGGGGGGDTIYGGGDADVISGDDGDDTLEGGAANDTLSGGAGTDSLSGGDGDDVISGGNGEDVLVGGAGLNKLNGGANSDFIAASAREAGRTSVDIVDGGSGFDTLTVFDRTSATISFALSTSGMASATGVALADGSSIKSIEAFEAINFGSGNDVFTINTVLAAPSASFRAGGGSDTLVVEWASDTTGVSLHQSLPLIPLELGAGGNLLQIYDVEIFRIRTGAGADNITTFAGADKVTTGDGNDIIHSGGGADVLQGGKGADQVFGEAGNDTLTLGRFEIAAGDVFNGGAGRDLLSVNTPASIVDLSVATLASIEVLDVGIGRAAGDVSVTKFGSSQLGAGLAASLQVIGFDGAADRISIIGQGGAVNLSGWTFTTWSSTEDLISIFGSASGEDLRGSRMRDAINGGDGGDTLTGGAGADALNGGDGADAASYALSTALVKINLSLGAGAGGDAQGDTLTSIESVTGSAFNDVIYGDAAANVFKGGAGDDKLTSLDGADVLNGGTGADIMAGGAGDDTYVVDDAGDVIIETNNAGADTVLSTIDYILGANLEILKLSGAAISATGNALANTLVGSAGDNILNGGLGIDTLAGGAGADTFVLDVAPDPLNRDTIVDFNVADDSIRLDQSIFSAAGATGALAASAFQLNGVAATADIRIIYNAGNGKLFYDDDGNGAHAAIWIATLSPGLALTEADFVIG